MIEIDKKVIKNKIKVTGNDLIEKMGVNIIRL